MEYHSYQRSLEDTVNNLYQFLGIVIIPVVTFSVLRVFNTGWLPVYGLHLILMTVILGLSYNRNMINYKVKVLVLIIMAYIAAVMSMVQFSVGSFSLGYFMLIILFARILLDKKTTILLFALSLITLVTIATLTIQGIIIPSIDPENYYREQLSWLNSLVTFVLLMSMIAFILTSVGNILLNKSQEIKHANEKLEQAIDDIQILRGIIPICTQCKKIRDDSGYWQHLEVYLRNQENLRFTHGLCEECLEEQFSSIDWPGRTST